MKYLRTDIYDLTSNGDIINSSEIAEMWSEDYEAAINYLVGRGANESDLRKYGITGNGEQSFSVCAWERDEFGGEEWLDNCSEAKYAEHFTVTV